MNQSLASTDTMLNNCEHCGRTFVRPGTLLKHLCEQKRRWQQKDSAASRIGYAAWTAFYSSVQPSKKHKDFRTFIASPYYSAFIKFGNYCCDINAVNVAEYTNHLIKNNIPIDNWNSDRVYTGYLVDYIKTEDPYDAIKRSVDNMMKIARDENIELRDVLRYVSKNKLCHTITAGHISPWVLYLSESGLEFLSSINDNQRLLIWDYIDTEKWNIKFKRHNETVEDIKTLIAQIGL